jgi:phage-related protein
LRDNTLDKNAIVVLEVDEKKTPKTPQATIKVCQERRKSYEESKGQKRKG